MKKYGKCPTCQADIVERVYKLNDGFNRFERVFACVNTISHSFSEDELKRFDIGYYKNIDEKKKAVFA